MDYGGLQSTAGKYNFSSAQNQNLKDITHCTLDKDSLICNLHPWLACTCMTCWVFCFQDLKHLKKTYFWELDASKPDRFASTNLKILAGEII